MKREQLGFLPSIAFGLPLPSIIGSVVLDCGEYRAMVDVRLFSHQLAAGRWVELHHGVGNVVRFSNARSRQYVTHIGEDHSATMINAEAGGSLQARPSPGSTHESPGVQRCLSASSCAIAAIPTCPRYETRRPLHELQRLRWRFALA
jgi:hypothetical protein